MTLHAEIADRWDRTLAVDALLDAIERGDSAAAQSLAGTPAVRAALNAELWTRLEVIAAMAACGDATLAAEAIGIVRAEPHLVAARFDAGKTLLHRAAAAWSIEFARALLELGADPNATNRAGHPPLYFAGNRFPCPSGLPDGHEAELIGLFRSHAANLDLAEGVKRCTALHMAARRGSAGLAHALFGHGAHIEARDSNGETPLRRAVNCRHPAVARVLVAAGADRYSRCNRGRSPRDVARTPELIEILQGQAADGAAASYHPL
jgi:hypothetical protein